MKKFIALAFFFILLACGLASQEKIDRRVENGIEVVNNHLEPYKVKGEPSTLVLERLFSVDTEQDSILKIGLTDIENFDVDPDGNLYLIRWRSDQNYIYKFDKAGRFISSFLRGGQGPGEIEWGGTVLVMDKNELIAKDPSKQKFLLYDLEGKYLKEVVLGRYLEFEAILGEAKYLVSWQQQEPEYFQNYFGISGSDFKDVKELGSMRWPNPRVSPQVKAMTYVFVATATRDRIFVGDALKGYEICVYDLNGTLIRKIRKGFKALKVPNDIKRNYEKPLSNPYAEAIRKKTVFPDHMPPFRYFFTDDEGRLYVMTWEKSKVQGEYVYDIYNSQGLFVGRTSLRNYNNEGPFSREVEMSVKVRNGRLYELTAQESGYRELVVYKMVWK